MAMFPSVEMGYECYREEGCERGDSSDSLRALLFLFLFGTAN